MNGISFISGICSLHHHHLRHQDIFHHHRRPPFGLGLISAIIVVTIACI
jgi:hypothetical protein